MTTLVTRCPQCRAAFRVVAEQLRLRDGKVRCGVCNAVFDARAHQEPEPQQPEQQQSAPQTPAKQTPAQQRPAPQTPAVVVRQPPAAEPPARMTVERPVSVAAVRLRVAEARRNEPAVPAAREPAALPPFVRPGPAPVLQRPASSVPPVPTTQVRQVPTTPVSQARATSVSQARTTSMPEASTTPVPRVRPPTQVSTAPAAQARAVPAGQPPGVPRFPQVPQVPQDAHRAVPTTASSQSPEPWLSQDAVTRPVPARAGRQREPSLGAASLPAAGGMHKREPVLRSGSAPLPMPASPSDRFEPPLHGQADHGIADEALSDGGGRVDVISHHRHEHHVPFVSGHGDAHTHDQHSMPRGSSVAHEPAHEAEDFVANGPRSGYTANLRSTRRSGAMQAFWGACCIVAGLAVVLQALWWWRTPIATHVPAMRSVYDAVCAGMGCRVGYVRVPGQLSIESSSIQPQALSQPSEKAQHMTLSAVLRNRASHAQPWPAIELTLTDFADVVVVRRVLQPSEYLPPGAPEFFASNTEREIAASLEVRGAPVSGYRLALFFP